MLKAMTFDSPEWVPCSVRLMPATWTKHREGLEALVLRHARVFPDYEPGSQDFDSVEGPLYEPGQHTDCWGTVWGNVTRGMSSHPVSFPLEDWAALASYVPPDSLTEDTFEPRDWDQVRSSLDEAKRRGDLAWGGELQHGFMYMRLFYLRRFENLMMDMATGEPRLRTLIRMVERYNAPVIDKCLALGAELMRFGDDLGLQRTLPMSPAMWRKFIKPSYERLFRPCREASVPIYLHTDGHVLEIIPDLIEVGVTALNPQFRSNGLAGLSEMAKGRVALDLDLDRQLFPWATPSQIEDHIGEAFEALYAPEGGLMLRANCGPDVSLENLEAICATFERLCRLPEV